MKIVRLNIRNFMGIKQVDLSPTMATIIKGKNRQGKTSILKAIESAFLAGDQTAKIRTGEDSAEILIEMDELFILRQIQRNGGSNLTVSDTNGEEVKRPQEYLNSIVGGFSFNPAEFFLLKPKDQIKYLLESFPLKLDKSVVQGWLGETKNPLNDAVMKGHALVVVQSLRKYFYDERTIANRARDEKKVAGQEQAKLIPAGFNVEEFDVNGFENLIQQISQGEQSNARLRTLSSEISTDEITIAELESKLKRAKENVAAKKAERLALKVVDIDALKVELNGFDAKRQIVLKVEKLAELRQEFKELRDKAEALDKLVVKLSDEIPNELMNKINVPVKGMTINDDGIFFDLKPFEDLCGQEQIDVSLAIAKALNGKFGIVCVDGIERLDSEMYALFCNTMAKDDSTQYFLTDVQDRNDQAITIENGMIKEKHHAA